MHAMAMAIGMAGKKMKLPVKFQLHLWFDPVMVYNLPKKMSRNSYQNR